MTLRRLLVASALGLALLACSSGTSAPVEDDAGVDAGRSNDAGSLDAGEALLPVCIARIHTVNGAPYEGQDLFVDDDIAVTGADSTPSTANGNIELYQWTILEKPAGSVVMFSQPTEMETHFIHDTDLAVDEPGRYRVALEVTDDQGARDECDPIEFHVLDK